MFEQFIQICLDIIIVFGAINIVLIFVLILMCISGMAKLNRLVKDAYLQYMMIKSFVSSPIRFIFDLLSKK